MSVELEKRKSPEEFLREIQMEESKKYRGHLKIFFGYAAGVGKTYAMLEAAHEAMEKGIDVIAGYIEPHARPQTAAMAEGLETLPFLKIQYNHIFLNEFNLDAALERKPELILVDELAHTNAEGCRHNKRYRDIEELLANGIDVYTTVNVQHIESLNDIVASITGVVVRERIPDSVFDSADQVELVDIEPQDLLERLKAGKVYRQEQAQRAVQNFFTVENLTALREIALRRCADRVNLLTESNRKKHNGEVGAGEHILVCLSSAPSNATIIRTAARLKNAFKARFTALFVETSQFEHMGKEDKIRLWENIRLAQKLGAKIETVYGDDIPLQVAEFARLSGVSKIVVGRSVARKRGFFQEKSLTDRLIEAVPNMDVLIIPDVTTNQNRYRKKRKFYPTKYVISDSAMCFGLLAAASMIGYIFDRLNFTEANIITVYIIGTLLVAVLTSHRIYSLISSLAGVLIFNFLFTEPRYSLQAYDGGYPVTFVIMFISACFVSSLAVKLKGNASQAAKSAYRTKILFEANQLFQQATRQDEIVTAMACQLNKLLNKDIIVYLVNEGELSKPQIFSTAESIDEKLYLSPNERAVATWVLKNNKHAGATTGTLNNAKCLYLAIRVNDAVYGVMGVAMGDEPLDAFENNILLSILGECALALENEKNAREKEEVREILDKTGKNI